MSTKSVRWQSNIDSDRLQSLELGLASLMLSNKPMEADWFTFYILLIFSWPTYLLIIIISSNVVCTKLVDILACRESLTRVTVFSKYFFVLQHSSSAFRVCLNWCR